MPDRTRAPPGMDTNSLFHRAIPANHDDPAPAEANSGNGSLTARVAQGLVTCVFAAVGTILGAVTGGLIGLATETGVVRGTGVGGITGALVSMEIVESSLAMWRSDEPAIWSVVYVLDVIWSLLTGRLVREKVDPAVLNAVESQMSAVESPVGGHGDGADIFETGGTSGMPRAAIDVLPEVKFAARGNVVVVDAISDQFGCSVCLQDFEAGERARSLPVCRHTFHLPCIDSWLLRHASCPLCRRAV